MSRPKLRVFILTWSRHDPLYVSACCVLIAANLHECAKLLCGINFREMSGQDLRKYKVRIDGPGIRFGRDKFFELKAEFSTDVKEPRVVFYETWSQ